MHGSAPDIAGKGIANPVGQIWSASMMLEHLGETAAEQVLARGGDAVTPDMGGSATTVSLGEAVCAEIRR